MRLPSSYIFLRKNVRFSESKKKVAFTIEEIVLLIEDGLQMWTTIKLNLYTKKAHPNILISIFFRLFFFSKSIYRKISSTFPRFFTKHGFWYMKNFYIDFGLIFSTKKVKFFYFSNIFLHIDFFLRCMLFHAL